MKVWTSLLLLMPSGRPLRLQPQLLLLATPGLTLRRSLPPAGPAGPTDGPGLLPLLPLLPLLLLAPLLAQMLLQNSEIAKSGMKNRSKSKMPLGAGRRARHPRPKNLL